jgi:hypothetical protein
MQIEPFITLSAELCGISEFTLRGTGCANLYLSTVIGVVGEPVVAELLTAYGNLPSGNPATREAALRATILGDEKLGPIARNVIKLWYVSTWFELPPEWREKFGVPPSDRTFIPSPYAYPEGLLWWAVGSHPSGAKAPGYASWTEAPAIPK